MIVDVDGTPLRAGDVCVIQKTNVLPRYIGTECTVVSTELEAVVQRLMPEWNVLVRCHDGEDRYGASQESLRKKREDLQKTTWADLSALGVDPRRDLAPA